VHRRVRAVVVGVAGVVSAGLFVPQGAVAQGSPTVAVTPSAGLEDGQTVTVTGQGFPALIGTAVTQCPEAAVLTDVVSVVTYCDFARAIGGSIDAAGRLVPTSYTVHEVINQSGRLPPGTTYDCRVSNDCSIAVVGFLADQQSVLIGAEASISFGPAIPTKRSDCTHGGWRALADDRGRPFRNQGGCTSYVAAHRR
jgi:hypothetical protein